MDEEKEIKISKMKFCLANDCKLSTWIYKQNIE